MKPMTQKIHPWHKINWQDVLQEVRRMQAELVKAERAGNQRRVFALQDRLVRGENIGQTFQFVKSGNAELGFVAFAQVKQPGQAIEGSFWDVPQSLYSPIEQQAVLLKDNDAARAFLLFMRSDESLQIIRDFGYATP